MRHESPTVKRGLPSNTYGYDQTDRYELANSHDSLVAPPGIAGPMWGLGQIYIFLVQYLA
jgi:hypothetical protein